MNSDRALFTRILCQFLLGGGLGFLLAVALLAANAHQLFDLISNSPSPYVLLFSFVAYPCTLVLEPRSRASCSSLRKIRHVEPSRHQELLDRSEKYAFVTPERVFLWRECLF